MSTAKRQDRESLEKISLAILDKAVSQSVTPSQPTTGDNHSEGAIPVRDLLYKRLRDYCIPTLLSERSDWFERLALEPCRRLENRDFLRPALQTVSSKSKRSTLQGDLSHGVPVNHLGNTQTRSAVDPTPGGLSRGSSTRRCSAGREY